MVRLSLLFFLGLLAAVASRFCHNSVKPIGKQIPRLISTTFGWRLENWLNELFRFMCVVLAAAQGEPAKSLQLIA